MAARDTGRLLYAKESGVVTVVDAELVDVDDARMLQPRHGGRLQLEAGQLIAVALLAGAQHLQGDLMTEGAVPRPIDDAHAAVAEDAEDLVAGYFGVFLTFARRQGRR